LKCIMLTLATAMHLGLTLVVSVNFEQFLM